MPGLSLSSVPFGSRTQPATAYNQSGRPYSPGALDVLNADRARSGQQVVKGVEDVRLRDQLSVTHTRAGETLSALVLMLFAHILSCCFLSCSQTERLRSPAAHQSTFTSPARSLGVTATLSETERQRLKKFESTRTNAIRPIVFQPNGSFRALKENGKLAVGQEEADVYKGRIKNPLAETAYHLPGYTGFVRGSQHISGRTFGETSRRALCTDYREIVCSSPVPSAPQANRKIRHEDLQDTFVKNMFGGKTYQIPGYTGFVPGVRSTYAKRYGAATEQEMLNHSVRFPRRDNQPVNFARTQLPREQYPLSSAPLPGGAIKNDPPEMYIPDHVRYVKQLLGTCSVVAACRLQARERTCVHRISQCLRRLLVRSCSQLLPCSLSNSVDRYLKFFPM